MNRSDTVYIVSWWIYCDTETLHSRAFTSQQDADDFEQLIWDKCQEAHVEVDVVKTESPLSYEDAEMELDEIFDQINPNEEEDDNE